MPGWWNQLRGSSAQGARDVGAGAVYSDKAVSLEVYRLIGAKPVGGNVLARDDAGSRPATDSWIQISSGARIPTFGMRRW